MGNLIMILGKSGSGKSASLRHFKPGEVGVFNVASKRLPFRTKIRTADGVGYEQIAASLAANNLNTYVVDDATYLMSFDNFRRAGDSGYTKFVDMAVAFHNLLRAAMATNDNTNVYFLMHPELDALGHEKPRTVGKMLDEKLCIEGLFPVVLDCVAEMGSDGEVHHYFMTQTDGNSLAKSPIGMFDSPRIDNDLKAVDATIREYWQMGGDGAEIIDTAK